MKLLKGRAALSPLSDRGTVVTLGNFDGLHTGHCAILKKLVMRAEALGLPSVVYTFDPHPLKVLAPMKPPPLIATITEKISIIESYGVDILCLARFTEAFAGKSPMEFVEDVVVACLRAKVVLVGHDYRFGRGGRGDVVSLKKFGKEFGFKVLVVAAVKRGGQVVSSSRIRRLIIDGEVREAAKLLGRPPSLSGCVVKGRGVGKELGFPTANIRVEGELVPKAGVYAVKVELLGKYYQGVVNIGTAPTFNRGKVVVEAHVIGFKGLAYGKIIKIYFISKVRGEKCFKTPDLLIREIERDVVKAVRILKKSS